MSMYTQVQVNWKRCNRVGVISELRLLFSVCDQCPGEDEHVQNEVHALLICQDHRVCGLRKHFSFLFSPFFEDFSAAQPFLLQQVNNQLNLFMISFLSRTIDFFFFFLSLWIYLWLAETSQQLISQQPGWRPPPIVTIVNQTKGKKRRRGLVVTIT